jgi:hypothetical protein
MNDKALRGMPPKRGGSVFDLPLRQADFLQQRRIPRVGVQGIKKRRANKWCKEVVLRIVTFLQPREGLVLVFQLRSPIGRKNPFKEIFP